MGSISEFQCVCEKRLNAGESPVAAASAVESGASVTIALRTSPKATHVGSKNVHVVTTSTDQSKRFRSALWQSSGNAPVHFGSHGTF